MPAAAGGKQFGIGGTPVGDIHAFEPLWGVWKIEKLLGKGSYGSVYLGRREDTGRVQYAAIKHIPIPRDDQELQDAREQGLLGEGSRGEQDYCRRKLDAVLREVDLSYRLKGNTNLVSYEDHTVIPRKDRGYDVFIRMEKLTGLQEYWKNRGGLHLEDVYRLGEDLCRALEVLEQEKLIHRDIKPGNILVNEQGRFKLGDFGVARSLENMTAGVTVAGTFNYMAPEIQRGDAVDRTADIYSLGLVLYRLCNRNRAPFLSADAAELPYGAAQEAQARRLRGEPLPPPAYAPPALSGVILRACAFRPADRYQTAAEFHRALEAARSAGESGVLPETELSSGGGRSSRSGWTLPGGSGSGKGPRSGAGSAGEKPQPARKRTPLWIGAGIAGAAAVLAAALALSGFFGGGDSGKALAGPSAVPAGEESIAHSSAAEPTELPENTETPEPAQTPQPTPSQTNGVLTPSDGQGGHTVSGEYWNVPFAWAQASSELASDGHTYYAENAMDGDPDTTWQEGVEGYGIGEYLELGFSQPQKLSLLRIFPGNGNYYTENGRPAELLVEFSDGSALTFDFPDSYGDFTLDLGGTVETSWVRLTIAEVYPGTVWEDTAITEVLAYGPERPDTSTQNVPQGGYYAVQVGAFQSWENAAECYQWAADLGFPDVVIHDWESGLYRVTVGCFSTQSEAGALLPEAEATLNEASFITWVDD